MTEDYYWDYYNATTGGQYLDSQESLIINDFLDCHTPRLCLDIACGSGRFSLPVMERGIHVVAGDCDRIPLKKLKGKLLRSPKREKAAYILQIDAEHLPFRVKIFDCVLSLQTVGYLDMKIFFFNCNRILKDGGWLLFNEGNRHSYKAAIHRKIGSKTQFYRHSHSEICSMLLDSGFRIDKTIGMNWLPIKRDSNSRCTPFASKIERILCLKAFPFISPWVFYAAQKIGHMPDDSIHNTDGDNKC